MLGFKIDDTRLLTKLGILFNCCLSFDGRIGIVSLGKKPLQTCFTANIACWCGGNDIAFFFSLFTGLYSTQEHVSLWTLLSDSSGW